MSLRARLRRERPVPATAPPLADRSMPLPLGAADHLRLDHPRLCELEERYAAVGPPVVIHSRWDPDRLLSWLDLPWFRGDTAYLWHYREGDAVNRLKYFVFLEHVRSVDRHGWLERLGEDGLFGCWTQRYANRPPCSRDLLDAILELTFLDRHLGIAEWHGVRVLDIGAGYGRLAHRASQALPGLADWACTDAVAVSTFLCEYYLSFREVAPPARVVALDEVDDQPPGSFDLAVNVHSFSECTLAAIRWWAGHLDRLAVPNLFLVPNEAEAFLSLERDGTRLDYLPVLQQHGYELDVDEPVFGDPAVRDVLGVADRCCLLRRR